MKTAFRSDMGTLNNRVACVDHTGREFSSIREMCLAWHVDDNVYYYRRNSGWGVERALTTPLSYRVCGSANGNALACVDHTGRGFVSIAEMCVTWGVSSKLYRRRVRKGWSQKDALTQPSGTVLKPKEKKIVDPFTGERFATTGELARKYGMVWATVYRRMRCGLSLKDALTLPLGKKALRKRAEIDPARVAAAETDAEESEESFEWLLFDARGRDRERERKRVADQYKRDVVRGQREWRLAHVGREHAYDD